MKTTKKRILALVLVALMVMFNVPFVGFAVDVDEPTRYSVIGNDKEGNVKFLRSSNDSIFLDNTDSHLLVWKTDSKTPSPFITVNISKSTAKWDSIVPISYVYVKTGNVGIDEPELYIDSEKNDKAKVNDKDKDNDNGSYGYLYDYTDFIALTDIVGTDDKDISHITFYYQEPHFGYLTIEKQIAKNVNLPEGTYTFSFQIYKGSLAVGQPITLTVDTAEGLTKVSDPIELPVGDYTVTELNPVTNLFEVVDNHKIVTVSESHTTSEPVEVVIQNNYAPKGSFKLIKNMSDVGDPLTEDKTFKFGIYEAVEGLQPASLSTPFKTVEVTLEADEETAFVDVVLPYGSYFVRELGTEVTESLYTLVSPDDNLINLVIDGTAGKTATFTNKYKAPTGIITVFKDYYLDEGVTAELPSEPEFSFDIINEETDEVVASFDLPNEDGDYEFASLPLSLGTYRVHEKSMDQGFKVVENDKIVEIEYDGTAVSSYDVTIENVYNPKLGNLIVNKVIKPSVLGGPVPGNATFAFELIKDEMVVPVNGSNTFSINTVGGIGYVTLYGLEAGTYTIEEINLGLNYPVYPAAVEVTVISNDTVTAQTITNYYTPDPEIKLEILKVIVDTDGNLINSRNGYEFELSLEPTETASEYYNEFTEFALSSEETSRTTFYPEYKFSVNAKATDSLSYQGYPKGFTSSYLISEIISDPDLFKFKSFKIDYYFGDEEVVTETTTVNSYVMNIFEGKSFADKIVITVTNTYTPDTPPVIPPEDDGDDEPTVRRIEDVPVEPVALTSPVVEEVPVEVPEELLPLAPVSLPKTGEVPATLFYGIGGMISALGVFLRRK